jgi:hypothetical protein
MTLHLQGVIWHQFMFPHLLKCSAKGVFAIASHLCPVHLNQIRNCNESKHLPFAGVVWRNFNDSIHFLSDSAFAILSLNTISFWPGPCKFQAHELLIKDIAGRSMMHYFGRSKVVVIDFRIKILCEFCFCSCKSPKSATFESDSKLQWIKKSAFAESGLTSIHVPTSVQVLCERCFCNCKSFTSETFEMDSKLHKADGNSFVWSPHLRLIEYPPSFRERSARAPAPSIGEWEWSCWHESLSLKNRHTITNIALWRPRGRITSNDSNVCRVRSLHREHRILIANGTWPIGPCSWLSAFIVAVAIIAHVNIRKWGSSVSRICTKPAA